MQQQQALLIQQQRLQEQQTMMTTFMGSRANSHRGMSPRFTPGSGRATPSGSTARNLMSPLTPGAGGGVGGPLVPEVSKTFLRTRSPSTTRGLAGADGGGSGGERWVTRGLVGADV